MANNQLLASDNFASGSLAAGWTLLVGSTQTVKVVAGSPNVTEAATVAQTDGQVWTGTSWPNDQISEVQVAISGGSANTQLQILLRAQQSASFTGYYALIGGAGAVSINKGVSGVYTTLASTTATIGAMDVWTFQVAGAVLSLYQNGIRILYVGDESIPSGGYPGYQQRSNTATSDNQVFSWRGYSLVQQDGVWTKQGIALPITSSDPTPIKGINTGTVLYEGNAQILSGTVFKCWFGSGGFGNTGNVYYAESTDGITWSRRSSPVISGYVEPLVFKYAGTYYCYCQPAVTGNSLTIIACYTSSDGITWTQQNATALGLGTTGAWDDTYVYSLMPITVIAGTWYATYAGFHTGNANWYMGLATSTDGINWTKYVSNPVYTNAGGSGAVAYLNGTAYVWGIAVQAGQGNANVEDPTESVRLKSTDFIHWTLDSKSLHHSQLVEGVNTNDGQGCAVSILSVGAKSYIYTISSQHDSGTNYYQIGVATAPTSLINLVGQPEEALSQKATDAFARSAGGLGTNWTTPTGLGAPQIASSGIVQPAALSASSLAYYSGASFSASQYSEVTIAALASGSLLSPCVYVQGGSNENAYELVLTGPTGSAYTSFRICKKINGAQTDLSGVQQVTPQVGDKIRLAVWIGSDGFPVLSAYQNGFLITQVQDYAATFTSGAPGFLVYATTSLANSEISGWAGGNANVIPSYPTAYNSFVGESAVEAVELEAYSWGEFHAAPRWKK